MTDFQNERGRIGIAALVRGGTEPDLASFITINVRGGIHGNA